MERTKRQPSQAEVENVLRAGSRSTQKLKPPAAFDDAADCWAEEVFGKEIFWSFDVILEMGRAIFGGSIVDGKDVLQSKRYTARVREMNMKGGSHRSLPPEEGQRLKSFFLCRLQARGCWTPD
jgi:hypothetical protein